VFRRQGDGGFEGAQGLALALPRQDEHQVEVDVVEPRLPGDGERGAGIGAAVDAAKPGQGVIIEALDTDGKPVDSSAAVRREPPRLGGSRVGFESDLRLRLETFPLHQPPEQLGKDSG